MQNTARAAPSILTVYPKRPHHATRKLARLSVTLFSHLRHCLHAVSLRAWRVSAQDNESTCFPIDEKSSIICELQTIFFVHTVRAPMSAPMHCRGAMQRYQIKRC